MSGMSPIPNLSLGKRLLKIAEAAGYRGEGAFPIPAMTFDGSGTINFIVTEQDIPVAPPGGVLFKPSANSFKQFQVDEQGQTQWVDLGDAPDLTAIGKGAGGASSGPAPGFPPLPSPKPPVDPDDRSILYPPISSPNTVAPSSALKEDGTLIHGSGNPASSMVVARNGEISLAGACRFYRRSDAFPATVIDSDGIYEINVNQSLYVQKKDWTWTYSISMDDTRNSANICDLYDISLEVRNLTNGKWMRYAGSFSEGQFVLYDARNDVRIVDNTTNANGSLCQNIQRITFYTSQFKPALGSLNGSPIGDYEFTLTAVRKKGDVPPVVAKWKASVIDEVVDDPSILVTPTVSVNTALNAYALTATNTLKHGSGNQSQNMVVATNGEIELAGACRFYRNSSAFAPTGTEYGINVHLSPYAAQKDWTWLYSVVLKDIRNSDCITDLYDVSLHAVGVNGSVNFVGSFVDGVFHFTDVDNSLDIVDNTTDPTGRLAQNIQRITFYKDQMNPELGTLNPVPIGSYEFTLIAKRKVGDYPDVVCTWTAEVIDEIPDDVSFITSPVYATRAMMVPQGLKGNGELLLGSGNKNGELVTVSNGELHLAGASRWYQAGLPFGSEDGSTPPTYNINLYQSTSTGLKDWTWFYGLAMVNTKNSANICDLYDVTMGAKHIASGTMVEFVGSFADGVFAFTNAQFGIGIVDNTTNAQGSVCQNSQRITFYKAGIPGIQMGANTGCPIGDYEFTLKAVRKRGNVAPMTLTWRAHVVDEIPPQP